MYEEEDKALAALNHAIDLGITNVDTAYAYGDGKSESRVGKVMASRRKDVWLATKIPDRTRDEFMRRLEASLKRLQTDHVDLLHIHSLGKPEDLAKIEAPDGALKGLLGATLFFLLANLATDMVYGPQAVRPEWMTKSRTYPLLNASGRGLVDWVQAREHPKAPHS
jgi:hypothetical protein